MPRRRDPTRRLLAALDRLDATATANIERAREIRQRIEHLRTHVEAGTPLPEVVAREPRPIVTELVTANIEALQQVGVELRRAEAEALRAHGLTIQEIADLFGVTRQRVSSLLRDGG